MYKFALAFCLSLCAVVPVHAYRDAIGGNRIYDSPEECRKVRLEENPHSGPKILDLLCSEETLKEVREAVIKLEAEDKAQKEKAAKRKTLVQACATRNGMSSGGSVRIGMLPEDVRLCGWGQPEKVNRSVGSWGVHEQWVYRGGNYLYIKNGKVDSWQN